MDESTNVVRLPLVSATLSLDRRIVDLCELQRAAGYSLRAAFAVRNDLVLIFQLDASLGT